MSDSTHVLHKDGPPYPGIYLCGQDALNFASHLANFIENPDSNMSRAICVELVAALKECERK